MIISKTPLRISFFGGNTDFKEYYLNYGGLVLDTTIDKFIYCIVVKRFDDLIIVNYSDKEIVNNTAELKHDIARECLKLLGIEKGIEITFLSDIPTQGSGLGSSSAVTVGLLNALYAYLGESIGKQQLAEKAIKIELDILGKPIGVQDQYIAAIGGLKAIDFNSSNEIVFRKIKISESLKEDFNNSLMLLYTGVTRKSSDVLSSLNIKNNKVLLDKNKELANNAISNLVKGNLREFGKLLDVSWKAKRALNSKTTNTEIDKMYDLVKKAGAIGAKIIGAGGGGFMLVMFPANKRMAIKEKLKNYREIPFRFEEFGTRIVLNI